VFQWKDTSIGSGPSRNIFRNNEIRDFNAFGIRSLDGSANEFVGNWIHSNDAVGICYALRVEDQDGSGRIDSNKVENTESNGTYYGLYSYNLKGTESDPYTIEGNTWDNNESGTNSNFYGMYNSGFTGSSCNGTFSKLLRIMRIQEQRRKKHLRHIQ